MGRGVGVNGRRGREDSRLVAHARGGCPSGGVVHTCHMSVESTLMYLAEVSRTCALSSYSAAPSLALTTRPISLAHAATSRNEGTCRLSTGRMPGRSSLRRPAEGRKGRWCSGCAKGHAGAVHVYKPMCEGCGLKESKFGLPTEGGRRWCAGCAKAHAGVQDLAKLKATDEKTAPKKQKATDKKKAVPQKK